MFYRLVTILSVSLVFISTSCTKENTTLNTEIKEDPNNYFTATYNGKTLKTTGLILTINGVGDDGSGSLDNVSGYLQTRNSTTGVKTTGMLTALGSGINLLFGQQFKIPAQHIDVHFSIERTGNAVGTYKISEDSSPGFYTSDITDLTVGRKIYDIDPTSTTVNITLADTYFIQGTYSGKLIDGTNKIPVTGTFKLRKF